MCDQGMLVTQSNLRADAARAAFRLVAATVNARAQEAVAGLAVWLYRKENTNTHDFHPPRRPDEPVSRSLSAQGASRSLSASGSFLALSLSAQGRPLDWAVRRTAPTRVCARGSVA